ncbi:hypothetical protein [Vibrio sp. 1180_3]|uniref:hypothetical protein n=1 Tax=Vibrio sp. 1180_3 TaxID=2528832 RepID=UPI002405EF2F|nr:hypothetical protein [Vibrio sp. 1180_3]MDF9399099.1 hypothetical protein [Vibrio sp. 1180_3]
MKRLLLISLIVLPSLNASAEATRAKAPEKVCRVDNPALAGKQCNNKDVFLFLPEAYGTANNLPVIVSAIFCDFEHPIITTPDAVTCVFSDSRKSSWREYGVHTD